MAEREEQLIADIMVGQQRLQRLFVYDRTDPLFNSHLTLTQIKILMLLARHGNISGVELAGMLEQCRIELHEIFLLCSTR